MSNCRDFLTVASARQTISAFSKGLFAQEAYPNRPVGMIVSQNAGGSNDIVGRIVSQKLAEVLNALVVVENRPGAGGKA